VDIRPFNESDEPDVIALWSAVFGYPAPHNDPASIIRHKLDFQRDLFFIARLDGRLVVMGGYDGHRGWVYSLAVLPQVRRRGIGMSLMRHVERELEGRGCPKVNLLVLASNAATVAFYEKLGYCVEERVSMGKVLGSASDDRVK
jgi:ribosomal protein S18 acetylase RimI-like enzyme